MPIPMPASAAKPRSQLNRNNSIYSRSERPGQSIPDESSGSTPSLHRTHQRADSQGTPLRDAISDAAQKRSFLPQRGLTRPGARGNVGTETELAQRSRDTCNDMSSQQTSLGDAKQPRPRPRSLYQTRASQQDTGVNANAHSSRSTDVNNKPAASAGLSRTQSLRRPGVPPQSTAPATRLHTRTQSINTTMGARKETGESDGAAVRVGRPKSLTVTSTQIRPSGSVLAEPATGVVRTSARLDAVKRSVSTRSKPALPHGRATAGTLKDSGDRALLKERGEPVKQELPKNSRPAFSTLQQHFTPKKVGKAPTATFIQSSEPVTHVLPPETVSLQNELLQLHLLHEPSALTNRQWELSAQDLLRVKFDEVASLYDVMQEKERFGQEQKNIMALREWSGPNSTSGLVEHIQALSGPLHELPSLLDSGGRFFDLVEVFNRWLSRADEVWTDRDGSRGQGRVNTLGGLGDEWKEEHAAMTRKLTAFSRHLDSLPTTVTGSSIAHIVSRCQSLVEGLLSELQVMHATESDAVAREKYWVEERLRTIAQDRIDVHLEADEDAWRLY